MVLDPRHYLAALERKPGSNDHAPVFRDWALPACFADLRARLERQHGAQAGSRQYARVLQLLIEHPLDRLIAATEACVAEQLDTTDAVTRRARSLAALEACKPAGPPAAGTSEPVRVEVPRPDLGCCGQLLGGDNIPISMSFA